MNYWWINQSSTYKTAISAGFIWAPKMTRAGRIHPSTKLIDALSIGDILFSNHLGGISAIGRVDGVPRSTNQPYDDLEIEGWLVPVTFIELSNQIKPKNHLEELMPFIEENGYPLNKNGHVIQKYLSSINAGFAGVLIQHIGPEYYDVLEIIRSREIKSIYEVGDLEAFKPTRINVSSASGIFPYFPHRGKFHILTGENGTGKTRYLEKLSADILHGLTIGLNSYSSMICFSGTIHDRFPKPQKSDSDAKYFYFGNKTNNNMFSEIYPFRQLVGHLFAAKPDYAARSQMAGQIFQSIGLASVIELQLALPPSHEPRDSEPPIQFRTALTLDGRYSRSAIPTSCTLVNIIFKKAGTEINLENLSSGERMYVLVVLALCFCLEDESLVLFDEPENSLHPKWQSEIIRDIHSITRNLALDATVVIATHAPLVVSSTPNVDSLIRDLPSTEDWLKFDLFGKNSDAVLETQFGLFSPRSLVVTNAIQKCLQALVMSDFQPEEFKKSADLLAGLKIDFDSTDPLFSAVKEILRVRSEMA